MNRTWEIGVGGHVLEGDELGVSGNSSSVRESEPGQWVQNRVKNRLRKRSEGSW